VIFFVDTTASSKEGRCSALTFRWRELLTSFPALNKNVEIAASTEHRIVTLSSIDPRIESGTLSLLEGKEWNRMMVR
jgi:hypothetical protein